MDKRWYKLADILVNYSTQVKPGERVMIAMHEVESLPLARATYESVVKAGGFPQIQFLSETLRHSLLQYGSDEQLTWVPEIEAYGMEWADVYIGLRGAHNLSELADIPTEKLALNQRAMGKVSTMRWEKTRWTLVRVPNEAFAMQADTDEETISDMFFDACLLDWPAVSKDWFRLAGLLEKGKEIRIAGKGTDLRFSVDGRKWVASDGRINMPDGEIFTSPVTETIDGCIEFEFPGVFGGRLMENIRFEWDHGRLVSATSSTNQAFLQTVVQSDAGSSLIGEFAIGTNPGVTRFCKDILIDEKIGGTIHIAMGRAYPECGGTNKSSIHWDIVKDTRTEGAIFMDGGKVFENGRFLL
jgi:aminopeptidase